MTGTLREKLLAIRADWLADGQEQKVYAADYLLALLDEHCAGQRERFEEWMKDAGYVEGLNSIARQAWQAAIATVTGDV